MIHLHSWDTSNGRKIFILLEELGLPYTYHPIDITKGQQFAPEFLAISPNNKIPAIVDTDGPGGEPLSLFESGAILMYLADKAGSELLPADPVRRTLVVQWLMFQMGGVGPMFGQYLHFHRYAKERVPYGLKRYGDEVRRLLGVLDRRLADVDYLAVDYSIADIAVFPWVVRTEWMDIDLAAFPKVKRWYDATAARPAVQRVLAGDVGHLRSLQRAV